MTLGGTRYLLDNNFFIPVDVENEDVVVVVVVFVVEVGTVPSRDRRCCSSPLLPLLLFSLYHGPSIRIKYFSLSNSS